ncbi:MAG: hypothetical protein EBR23_08500, partial [Planctomycetia bacterium]|nr:hypothetical protein [Planctomycetia bacterium]
MPGPTNPDPKKTPARPPLPAGPKVSAKPPVPQKPAAKAAPPAPGKAAVVAAAAAAAARATPASAAGESFDDEVSLKEEAIKQAPAWAISMLVHIVALLAMALIVNEPPQQEEVRIINAAGPESEEEFAEPQDEMPVEAPSESVDASADVMVATDVAVEPVEVVANADDVDAAPLAVELTDFSDTAAPATDMMATIGAVGGTGGGFGGRANAGAMARAGGGGSDTEEAVDRALKWLIEHQMPDGGWSFDIKACPKCEGKCSHPGSLHVDRAGATAMALLPFLGRGYTHKEGPYKSQLERGVAFLAALSQRGNGKVFEGDGGHGAGNMYSQGLAGIALSECYAMSQDNRLQSPTQSALNFIMMAQDPVGGGWRYRPREAGDTSAVGWQIMALKSGNMAYLQINPEVVKKASAFLDHVEGDSGATYGYTDSGSANPTRSAIGLLCRMYLGWKKDHPALQDGVSRLAKAGPNDDLYYDYYATQIMHHMEG